MPPRRVVVSRHGQSRSVSMADENAPTSLVGPQRSKNAAGGLGLAAAAHKGRVPSKSSAPPVVIPATRKVLGDVSNAVATAQSKDVKPPTKIARVRKVASSTSLEQPAVSTGLSSALGKGLSVATTHAATVGGQAGKRLVAGLRSRSAIGQSVLEPAQKRKSITKSLSVGGAGQAPWASGLVQEEDKEVMMDEFETLINDDDMPGSHIKVEEEEEMMVDPTSVKAEDEAKVTLPDAVFAAAEAENVANTSEKDLEEDEAFEDSVHQAMDSDENELSLCRNNVDDDLRGSQDLTNWLLLGSDEEVECRAVIEAIKRDFQEELDYWDTTMVAEYSEDIFKYMEELEESTLPNPRYMDSQTEIEWDMRTTLIDWLLQVHMRYHMMPETLWIAVNIIDRFLSKRVVSLVKFQLVGVTAMFVAAKYEEIMAPSVEEFVYMTENGYTREEILKGEKILLTTLDFKISPYCSPYSWLRRISKADDYDIQTRTLSKFLMELTLLDHRFLRAKSSMIAAIGMYTARKMLGGNWSDAFIFYSGYTEAQLITPMSFLLEFLSTDGFEERFVYKKYANRRFLKASIFARSQALKKVREESSSAEA